MTVFSISAFALALGLTYVGLIEYCLHHWERLPEWRPPVDYQPGVFISVIVPVRNEAQNIRHCIHSLQEQDYPEHLYEILIIDDHSEDDTSQIIRTMAVENLRLLHLAEAGTTAAGKKPAIDYAIQHARGSLLITTDGDCRAPSRWLSCMASYYESHQPAFFTAPVVLQGADTLLERFQALDTLGMMVITGAGIAADIYYSSNGANLGYPREVYRSIGGFAGIDHLASGDDILLMHKIANQYPGRIGFVKSRETTVRTHAAASWRAFWQQRLRWATKSRAYRHWAMKLVLLFIFLLCWAILLSPLLTIAYGWRGLIPFALLFSMKAFADYRLLSRATRYFGYQQLITYFWSALLVHIFYINIVGLGANFFSKYPWKGRITK